MEPDPHTPADYLEPLERVTLRPEFVRIDDGSRVVLLHEIEFVQVLAALR
ncbi:hypothetical protein [Thioalkalivibrio sp. ALJ24]|nr:hypothetical protein [Thioalkalivibrio sp. ALJ24]